MSLQLPWPCWGPPVSGLREWGVRGPGSPHPPPRSPPLLRALSQVVSHGTCPATGWSHSAEGPPGVVSVRTCLGLTGQCHRPTSPWICAPCHRPQRVALCCGPLRPGAWPLIGGRAPGLRGGPAPVTRVASDGGGDASPHSLLSGLRPEGGLCAPRSPSRHSRGPSVLVSSAAAPGGLAGGRARGLPGRLWRGVALRCGSHVRVPRDWRGGASFVHFLAVGESPWERCFLPVWGPGCWPRRSLSSGPRDRLKAAPLGLSPRPLTCAGALLCPRGGGTGRYRA